LKDSDIDQGNKRSMAGKIHDEVQRGNNNKLPSYAATSSILYSRSAKKSVPPPPTEVTLVCADLYHANSQRWTHRSVATFGAVRTMAPPAVVALPPPSSRGGRNRDSQSRGARAFVTRGHAFAGASRFPGAETSTWSRSNTAQLQPWPGEVRVRHGTAGGAWDETGASEGGAWKETSGGTPDPGAYSAAVHQSWCKRGVPGWVASDANAGGFPRGEEGRSFGSVE
jgi:hypothetical protein